MRVLPISKNIIQTSCGLNQNIHTCNTILKDSFVKSPNFSALNTFSHNYEQIYPLIKRSYLEGRATSLQPLREIVQRFFPHVQVKDMLESPNFHEMKIYGAYFQNKIALTRDFKVISDEQTLFFKMPGENQDKTKLTFFTNAMHEITHVMQENSKDRQSRADWMQLQILRVRDKQTLLELFTVAPQIFSSLEQIMTIPLKDFLCKQENLPREIFVRADATTVNEIYNKLTGANFDTYIDYVLSEVLKRVGFNGSKESFSNMIQYSKQYAFDEYEAYMNGINFAKEMLGMKRPTDLDLFVQTYKMLADRLNFLINNTK